MSSGGNVVNRSVERLKTFPVACPAILLSRQRPDKQSWLGYIFDATWFTGHTSTMAAICMR